MGLYLKVILKWNFYSVIFFFGCLKLIVLYLILVLWGVILIFFSKFYFKWGWFIILLCMFGCLKVNIMACVVFKGYCVVLICFIDFILGKVVNCFFDVKLVIVLNES